MPEPRWKKEERRLAKHLGGWRNPSNGSGKPDVESEWLVVEVKDRAKFPQWMYRALSLARMKAGPKRLGIVTLTSPNTPEVLVLMTLHDFKDWHGWTRRSGRRQP